jgi:tetratricopeptide (TPR) repeat protein
VAPSQAAVLDRIELLITHTLGAGRLDDAAELYSRGLGGFSNLGLVLGDMSRGDRVTRAFGDEAPLEVLYDRGLYAGALGDLAGALAAYGRYCRRAESAGSLRHLTTGLRTTAYTERLAGELGRARVSIDASLEAARALGDRSHLVRGLALLGAVLTDAGDLDEAVRAFDRAREMDGDPVARRGIWEAECLIARGSIERAEALTTWNEGICEARGWPGHVAHCALVLGRIAARKGDLEAARRRLAAVRSWTDRTGEIELVLGAHLLAAELGDAREARVCAELALRLGYGTARARALALA